MTRATRIHFRLTPEEKQIMADRAKAVGYTLSEFVRECGVTGKVEPVLSINLAQWGKLGGLVANLNQLTRHVNTGTLPPELGPTLTATLDEVVAVRRDITTKQGERS
jgi:hypothetical protein